MYGNNIANAFDLLITQLARAFPVLKNQTKDFCCSKCSINCRNLIRTTTTNYLHEYNSAPRFQNFNQEMAILNTIFIFTEAFPTSFQN